jgi:hypothetical protein
MNIDEPLLLISCSAGCHYLSMLGTWLFDFVNNHWFQFFKKSRIREPLVPVLEENQNQRITIF